MYLRQGGSPLCLFCRVCFRLSPNFRKQGLFYIPATQDSLISQRELAKKISLTQRIVNYYENKPKSIPVEKLRTLAEALDVTIADLFSEEETHPLDKLDVRWIKKINQLRQLSEADQREINRHLFHPPGWRLMRAWPKSGEDAGKAWLNRGKWYRKHQQLVIPLSRAPDLGEAQRSRPCGINLRAGNISSNQSIIIRLPYAFAV